MQTKAAIAILAYAGSAASQAVTARINAPGNTPAGCAVSQNGIFGIQVVNSAGQPLAKRQVVSAIADGQPQRGTSTAVRPVTVLPDGQPNAPGTTATARPVTVLPDGQPNAPAGTPTAAAVRTVTVTRDLCVAQPMSQIADGQVQAPMRATTTARTATPVSQIGDGQIQQTRAATPVSQIGDGQIQQTATRGTATPVSQIGDGQIQQTSRAAAGTPVTQIGDGQIQRTTLATSTARTTSTGSSTNAAGYAIIPSAPQACRSGGVLEIKLNNGVLTDSQNRIGYIASNSQFQFDGPPQAGAIYTAGWSLCSNGSLALGGSTTFYQCLSGNFYNLYYRNVLNAGQCTPIQIEAVQLNTC